MSTPESPTPTREPVYTLKGVLWPLVIVAVVAAGGYWFWREGKVRECRASASAASIVNAPYGDARIDAALALSHELNAQATRKCYEEGFLPTPYG